MKVLLINPPNSVKTEFKFPITIFQPLGLAYIAAVLEKNAIEVRILDALAEGWTNEKCLNGMCRTGLDDQDLIGRILDYKPGIVGIASPFSSQAHEAHHAARLVKSVLPDSIVVLGGAHPSTHVADALSDKNVDYVIQGEGEYSFLELVKTQNNNGITENISNLAYRKKNEIIVNTVKFIENLDELPMPARHLLPMNIYFQAAGKVKSARSISTYRKNWATIFTSRGCPYRCVFCTISKTMGRKWRARSPENIFEEIQELCIKYNIRHFDIEDDNLTLDKERAKKLFRLIISRGLKFEWSTPNGIRADAIDEETIMLMKKSGCCRTIVAPESGVQRVVDNIIKKNLSLDRIEKAVSWCRKYRLLVECFFVIGFPGETIADIKETIRFAKKLRKLGADDCGFFIATPFYGTELYDLADKNGYLSDKFDKYSLNTLSGVPMIITGDFSADDIKRLWAQARKINPVISAGRIKLALSVFLADPSRGLRFAKDALWNFLKK